MTTDRRWRTLLLSLAAALAGCATPAVVMVAPNYGSAHVQRVAVVQVTDFPGVPGSGEAVASSFEKYLLWGGYSLVERRQVEQLMQEQNLTASGAFDPATLHQLGRLLGVDALAFGSVSTYSDARLETVMVDMPLEQTSPIYGQVTTVQRSGNMLVRNQQDVVTGYSTIETDQVVPQTQTTPAHVGLSIRLVDASTGEILWSGSASSDGADLTSATEQASAALMQGVVKQLKKS